MEATTFRTGGVRPLPASCVVTERGGGGTDQLLVEAVRRAVRYPEQRMALVLHLSRLAPPAPRAHHRRIARAILEDTARSHEGQVFAVGNGDMVLLCREGDAGRAGERRAGEPAARGLALPDPAALPATLGQLLRIDAPDAARLTTVWQLQHEPEAVAAYAAARAGERAAAQAFDASAPGEAAQTAMVDAIGGLLGGAALSDVMQRQTGVVVARSDTRQADGGPLLRPLYREVTFSIAALEAKIEAAGQATADPFLFRHLARRLDARMLAQLHDAIGGGGPLDPVGAGGLAPRTHIHLTLQGILSDGFARAAERCRSLGAPLGVEVALVEACGDAARFGQARRRLAGFGATLVLGGVSHLALLLARPWALQPDMVKLDWSPRLGALPADDLMLLSGALDEIGPHRLVLGRADTEAALRWGLSQGIRRFQGRHVDAMLAASRLATCPAGQGCALRQCAERATAAGAAGRAGCRAPVRLDAAVPGTGTP